MDPTSSRQAVIESPEKSNYIAPKGTVPSTTLSRLSTTHEQTTHTTAMIPMKARTSEQEMIRIALPSASSNVNYDRPTVTTLTGLSTVNPVPPEVFDDHTIEVDDGHCSDLLQQMPHDVVFDDHAMEFDDGNSYDPLLELEELEEFPFYYHF